MGGISLSTTIGFISDFRSMCRRSRMSDEETAKELQAIDDLLHQALFNPKERLRESAISMLDAVCGYIIRKAFVGDGQIMAEVMDQGCVWRVAYYGEVPPVYGGRLVQEAYPFLLRQHRREPADF